MSALPQTTASNSPPIGNDLAIHLKKDWDSIRKRFREKKGGADTFIGKSDPLSIEAIAIFEEAYGAEVTNFKNLHTFKSADELKSGTKTIVRKIETPQYKPPPVSREQIEEELKGKFEREQKQLKATEAEKRQNLRDDYESKILNLQKQLQAEKQSTGGASAAQTELRNQIKTLETDNANYVTRFKELENRINLLKSAKADLESKVEEAAKLDVHQRIEQLRTSIESEYQQKLLLALEERKTEAAAEAAEITAEMSAKQTQEILKIKADSREQIKKEVNIVTQNLRREIQALNNIISDKDIQLEKAYSEVGVDPTEDVPFTNENVKWLNFTVIALAAAIIFSKFESTMSKALFGILNENWLHFGAYFILAVVLQLFGVYASVNYNRVETLVKNPDTGKEKWVVTIGKEAIYVIVAVDIVVELVGFVWDFFDKNLDWRFIIGAVVIAIILPAAHYFSSHIILEHLRKKIQERLNYGL